MAARSGKVLLLSAVTLRMGSMRGAGSFVRCVAGRDHAAYNIILWWALWTVVAGPGGKVNKSS
jgi:hypothetical protein